MHRTCPSNSDVEDPTLDVRRNADLVRFVVDHTSQPADGWATASAAYHLRTAILGIYYALTELSSEATESLSSAEAVSVTVMVHHYSAPFHHQALSIDELHAIGATV